MWRGSVVIKRIHLLNMKANLEAIWKCELSDGSRSNVMGQMNMLERIIEKDTLDYRWDDFIQYHVWNGSYCTCPPSKTFEWLFDPTPLEYEEQMETWRLLNLWATIDNMEKGMSIKSGISLSSIASDTKRTQKK